MKRIVSTALFILFVSMCTMGSKIVAKGPSYSAFGDFQIEKLEDHMIINNKEMDKYLITWKKTDLKVVVAVDKQKRCKKYYVLADKIPVQYECNGTYFGIKQLDKDLLKIGFSTTLANLNRQEYYRQKIITGETTATLDHLQLIASYYPGLYPEKKS
jgi:uncharacterized CHY-type Zn-finger protein